MRTNVLRSPLSDLVHRYAALADQCRADELANLFVEDGVLVLPRPPARLDAHEERRGRAAIATQMQVLRELTLTTHELVGEVFDQLEEDHARGRVACVAHHVSEGRDVTWHLHYDDIYRQEGSVWRFERRELHIDFITHTTVARARC